MSGRARWVSGWIAVAVASALLCLASPSPVLAEVKPWQDPGLDGKRIDIVVVKQDLVSLLQTIGEQTGLKVTLAKGLSGTVSNTRLKGSLRSALDTVSEQVGAIWWWNGMEIRMAGRGDVVTRSIKIRDPDHLLSVAKKLGLPTHVLSHRRSGSAGILRVTGPSALVSDFETLAKEVAEQLNNVKVVKYGARRSIAVDHN